MIVIQAIHLQEKGGAPGYKMALYDFGDMLDGLDNLGVFVRFGKGHADKGAHIQPQRLGLHQQAGTGNDAIVFQALDTLMNGRSAHATFTGNLQIRHPGVLDQERKNFLIDGINLITGHNLQFIRKTFYSGYENKEFPYKLQITQL